MNCGIIHIFYQELLHEIIDSIKRFNLNKIIFTTCDESILKQIEEYKIENSEVFLVENKGMDIGPFLLALDRVPIDCKYIYKIHSKKDNIWRKELLDGLPDNPSDNPVYGSKKWTIKDHSGYDRSKIIQLAEILGFEYPDKKFVAGTIFCIRKDILFKWIYPYRFQVYQMMECGFFNDREEPKFTHSMERILTCLPYLENKTIEEIVMPENFNNKFLFIHIPRTGGLSIINSLSSKNFIYYNEPVSVVRNKLTNYNQHFKFSIVRDPFGRVVSEYRNQKIFNISLPEIEIWFDSFIHSMKSLPQSIYIDDHMDFVGRFEDLLIDFEYITEMMGLSNVEFVNTNKSEIKPINVSINLKNKIYKFYKEDFKKFNY